MQKYVVNILLSILSKEYYINGEYKGSLQLDGLLQGKATHEQFTNKNINFNR